MDGATSEMQMTKPTKMLLIGIASSLSLLVLAFLVERYLAAYLASLIRDCEASNGPDGPWKSWQGYTLLCSPFNLIGNYDHVGIQKEIVEAHYNSRYVAELAPIVAGVILFLSTIPWLWHFLLRRIRELSGAIRGD